MTHLQKLNSSGTIELLLLLKHRYFILSSIYLTADMPNYGLSVSIILLQKAQNIGPIVTYLLLVPLLQ